MKQFKSLLLILLLFSSISFIVADTTIPRIEPYVNDFAGLLSPEEELQLNLLADSIEQNTTFEIAIVTVQSTGGQDRLQYANMIGDENGVGKKDADNGIVVLWSVSDDTGLALATGRGSESFVTDAKSGEILRSARSYFNNESYANGFNYIITELNKVIVKHQTPINNSEGFISSEGSDLPPWFWLVLFIGSMFILIPIIKGLTESSGDDYNDYDSSDDEDGKGYWRKQVYKRNGKWYNKEADRSYSTAAAAAIALSILTNSDSEDSDDESSGGSGSGGGFSGVSWGGGGFGGGGGKG